MFRPQVFFPTVQDDYFPSGEISLTKVTRLLVTYMSEWEIESSGKSFRHADVVTRLSGLALMGVVFCPGDTGRKEGTNERKTGRKKDRKSTTSCHIRTQYNLINWVKCHLRTSPYLQTAYHHHHHHHDHHHNERIKNERRKCILLLLKLFTGKWNASPLSIRFIAQWIVAGFSSSRGMQYEAINQAKATILYRPK